MFRSTSIVTLIFGLVLLLGACEIVDPDQVTDPNNPSEQEVLQGASEAQLQNLVTGLEVRHRAYSTPASGAIALLGTFGREFYPLFESDPRFIDQWMGMDSGADAESDGNFFVSGSVYPVPYQAIRQGNLLIEAVNNTEEVTDQERAGYTGFAKTIQGFQYLLPLLSQGDNGIRFDVSDPLNPGPFLGFDEALQRIRGLLDDGLQDLQSAGSSFNFQLHEGFSDFNTPSTMTQLNRAIAARAAIYAEDWQGALDALNAAQPFFELAEGEDVMNKGAYHVFGQPPDIFNPLFFPRNAATSQILMVHPSMPADIEAGDERGEKFFLRDDPVVLQGLSSQYQDNRFETNEDPIPFMRNEELILIYAEALAQRNQAGDLAEAVDAINLVRNTWGLSDFSSTDQQEIIDQILFERRYSLWGEFGHRWIDARRYNRLDQLPTDGGQIWEKLARPLNETNFEEFIGSGGN